MSRTQPDAAVRTGVVVRPLAASDLEQVAAIYNHAVRTSTVTLDTEEKSLAELEAWLRHHDDRYVALAAVDGDRLAGYGSLSPFAARGGYRISAEMSLYLDPAHTGRGIGTMLGARLVEHAEAVGFTSVLSVVTSSNLPPQRLVERLGFVHVGTLRAIGLKHGHLVDLVCHQLFFERNIARWDGGPAGTGE